MEFLSSPCQHFRIKGDTKRWRITGPVNRSGVYKKKMLTTILIFFVCVCVNLWSSLLKTRAGKSQKRDCECCHFVSGGLCLWHPEQNQHACTLPHQPAFFCFSLLKSKPTWLCCEELRLGTENYFCCMNIDQTYNHTRSMQIKCLHISRPACIFAWRTL